MTLNRSRKILHKMRLTILQIDWTKCIGLFMHYINLKVITVLTLNWRQSG